jgi:TIGR03009 family protein
MTRRVLVAAIVSLACCKCAWSQNPQPGGPQPQRRPAQPQPQQPAGGIPARPVARQVGGAPAGIPAAQVPLAPQPPQWALQMNAEEYKWLDEVLGYWEMRSNKVKTFSCRFACWEYNAFAPPEVAQKYSEGVIKYAQPDKGLFRVEKLSAYEPPPPMTPPPDKPKYIEQDKTLGEHWVCDGKQVFQFDARARKVIITPLPVEMQGRAIADGPLPFMFGAKAETIKARYWVRGLQGPPGKYLLEAVPKSRQDAQNFKMVHILLDQADYLPEMLQVFEPNSTEQNRFRKTYKFSERQTTDDKLAPAAFLQFFNVFQREFYQPQIPPGWKKELQSDVVSLIGPQAAGARPPQEAQRPAGPQKSFSPLPR